MALNSDDAWDEFKTRVNDQLGINMNLATQKALFQILLEVVFDHIVDNAEVNTTLDSSLNTLFVPPNAVTPGDGGALLQTNLGVRTVGGVKDQATGGVT